jgi:hypothetical protein
MSTAIEILARMAEAQPRVEALSRSLDIKMRDLMVFGTFIAIGRDVCAKRARKLRRRGEDVRYVGQSKSGKPRYRWMRRIDPRSVYLEQP